MCLHTENKHSRTSYCFLFLFFSKNLPCYRAVNNMHVRPMRLHHVYLYSRAVSEPFPHSRKTASMQWEVWSMMLFTLKSAAKWFYKHSVQV